MHGHIPLRPYSAPFDIAGYYVALAKRYQRLDLDALTPPEKEEYLQLQLRSVFVEQNVRESPPPLELPKELWEKLRHEKEIHAEDFPEGVTLEDVRRVREVYYPRSSHPVLEVLTDPRIQYATILGARRRGIRENRWTVFGQTCGGRYLVAVIAPYPRRGVWRAVTARDMERHTRRRYQQWRKS